MKHPFPAFSALALGAGALLLSACGGSDEPGRGSVVGEPTRASSLSAAQLSATLSASPSGQGLLQVAGAPKCGIDTYHLEYRTVGARNEPTNATAAVMVPTGTDAACAGARPVLLYTHGTNIARSYNLAQWADPAQPAAGEGSTVAALMAAQGYVVVAPNYAGYDQSALSYHPYINGDQQGKDASDSLTAARRTFVTLGVKASDALFITGYSQGGYVAMATHREMQAMGQKVSASAPLAAPSAISLLLDYSFSGWPALGGTVFVPLLTSSWQKQFGDVYNSPNDVFEAPYATGIETLLPTASPDTLFSSGKLPLLAQFPTDAVPGPIAPALSIHYGANALIKKSYLSTVVQDLQAHACPGNALPASPASLSSATPLDCKPAVGLRKAAVANDLRNWTPTRPMLMCGGAQDPTVNFLSTRATVGYFLAKGVSPAAITLLDLEDSAATDSFSPVRAGFAQAKQGLFNSTPGSDVDKQTAVISAYHGGLAPPFCLVAARAYFQAMTAP